jgi:hypothetical protein
VRTWVSLSLRERGRGEGFRPFSVKALIRPASPATFSRGEKG